MADCGVACIVSKKNTNIAALATISGVKLQHRGELSSGVSLWRPNSPKIVVHKGKGIMREILEDRLDKLYGTRAQVHVRYATTGAGSDSHNNHSKEDYLEQIIENAQPFYRRHGNRYKRFSLSWNGTIKNTDEICQRLQEERHYYDLETNTDTELILHTIAVSTAEEPEGRKPDLKKVFTKVASALIGGYCITYLNGEGTVVALRDPLGIRPLCY